jgi:RimJ/RimL family protein N-acetyltransferase
MIYAETERLILRSLEKSDLPRVVELIGDWDVTQWLAVVPYPYVLKDAEEFFVRMNIVEQKGAPEYFLMQRKSDNAQVGAVGLHPSREHPEPGKLEIGYWLGKPYWGQGYMTEAVKAIIDIAFRRSDTMILTSVTDPQNEASQNVLRKVGLRYLGVSPRRDDDGALRGSAEITSWNMTRDAYMTRKKAA